MMDPRYRDLTQDNIPRVTLTGGVRILVIAGQVGETRGPMDDIVIEPEVLDVTVPGGATLSHPTKAGHTLFAYVFEGEGLLGGETITQGHLALFGEGTSLEIAAGEGDVRFLLVSGKPLGEPIAWRGPIVMNTQEELRLAFQEYQDGTFVKMGRQP